MQVGLRMGFQREETPAMAGERTFTFTRDQPEISVSETLASETLLRNCDMQGTSDLGECQAF